MISKDTHPIIGFQQTEGMFTYFHTPVELSAKSPRLSLRLVDSNNM